MIHPSRKTFGLSTAPVSVEKTGLLQQIEAAQIALVAREIAYRLRIGGK